MPSLGPEAQNYSKEYIDAKKELFNELKWLGVDSKLEDSGVGLMREAVKHLDYWRARSKKAEFNGPTKEIRYTANATHLHVLCTCGAMLTIPKSEPMLKEFPQSGVSK